MKANPFIERAPIIRACAECFALLKGLEDDALLPTKQFNRRSEAHRAKWLELSGIAERQAQLSEAPATKRVVRKAKVAPVTPSDVSDANTSVPITQATS